MVESSNRKKMNSLSERLSLSDDGISPQTWREINMLYMHVLYCCSTVNRRITSASLEPGPALWIESQTRTMGSYEPGRSPEPGDRWSVCECNTILQPSRCSSYVILRTLCVLRKSKRSNTVSIMIPDSRRFSRHNFPKLTSDDTSDRKAPRMKFPNLVESREVQRQRKRTAIFQAFRCSEMRPSSLIGSNPSVTEQIALGLPQFVANLNYAILFLLKIHSTPACLNLFCLGIPNCVEIP